MAVKYLGSGRMSLFGGLGYTPSVIEGDANGVTVAAGVRGYTAGVRHRGFLELSVAQIEVEQSCFAHCRRPYGPGLQAGYQYVANGGCLPMLLQFPVFLGLYYALAQAIELRHAHFAFWIHDLSERDPYFVTPIIMGVTMFVQLSDAPQGWLRSVITCAFTPRPKTSHVCAPSISSHTRTQRAQRMQRF